MQSRRALFITLEGIEGSGKSTQTRLLSDFLSASDIEHVVTREPGGTPVGEEIRRLLLETRAGGVTPLAELLLYIAARAEHLATVIEPTLAAGRTVLCDRYKDATVAYQGHGRGLPLVLIARLHALPQLARQPDLTLVLDLDPEIALARAHSREAASPPGMTRFEDEPLPFHRRVREGYRAVAASEPARVRIIDASGPPDEVQARLRAPLLQQLGLGE